jgi:hypothetical protein
MSDLSKKWTQLRQGGLFDLLTGKNPQQISDMVSAGESPYKNPGNRTDLATHALTSKLMAERIGVLPSRVLGVLNELGGGAVSMATGGGFFGETGFDTRDLNANEVGFEAARGGASRFFETGTDRVKQLLGQLAQDGDGVRVHEMLKELSLQGIESGDFNLMEEAERGELGVKERAAEKARRIQEHPTRVDPRTQRPGQGLALAGQTALQTVPPALDPIGSSAEAAAKAAGKSDEAALIIGLMAGLFGPGLFSKALKGGGKKAASELASGASLNMRRGIRSLPPEQNLLSEMEQLMKGPVGKPVHPGELVADVQEISPTYNPRRPSEAYAGELDVNETALDLLQKMSPAEKELYIERPQKALEQLRETMRQIKWRAGGKGPGGEAVREIMEQKRPFSAEAWVGDRPLVAGGIYNPRERDVLLDPAFDPNLPGTAAHEVGHDIIRSASNVAPARGELIERERDLIKTIHELKETRKQLEKPHIAGESAWVSPELQEIKREMEKNFNSFNETYRKHQELRLNRGLQRTGQLDEAVRAEAADPATAKMSRLLEELERQDILQPYRPPEHPTVAKTKRGYPERHGWDEGMADLIESYTLRPEELNENVRKALDELFHGSVK